MSKIVILGAGESGAGAAVLAKKEGFEVFVSDMSKIKDNYKKLMDDHNIEWEEGHHTEEKILDADEVIKSPGIPKEAPMIQKLMAKGTPIISEIEFAGRYTDAKMICITGSNGKTTTTSLIYHIIKSAGYDVGLAGNIGKSLALQVAETPHKYYVIELSSFQLDNMYEFRANVAILLIWTAMSSRCRTIPMPRCASPRTRQRKTASSSGMMILSLQRSWLSTTSSHTSAHSLSSRRRVALALSRTASTSSTSHQLSKCHRQT